MTTVLRFATRTPGPLGPNLKTGNLLRSIGEKKKVHKTPTDEKITETSQPTIVLNMIDCLNSTVQGVLKFQTQLLLSTEIGIDPQTFHAKMTLEHGIHRKSKQEGEREEERERERKRRREVEREADGGGRERSKTKAKASRTKVFRECLQQNFKC